VFCLLLLVRRMRTLLTTITAFTLGHSIALALATLGVVHIASAPVEATIALSIVFLASELAEGETGRSATTRKYPWLIALSFGLLHGLGFAGALAEVELPQGEIPVALFSFNVGVELGQLAFVRAVLSIGCLLRSTPIIWPVWAPRVAAYAVGSTAACWVFARIVARLGPTKARRASARRVVRCWLSRRGPSGESAKAAEGKSVTIEPIYGSNELLAKVMDAIGPDQTPLIIGFDGCCGAGKTSVALWLGWQLGFPVVHLDL
jgi:hypothetical protein